MKEGLRRMDNTKIRELLNKLINLSNRISEESVYIEHVLGLFCYRYLSGQIEQEAEMVSHFNKCRPDEVLNSSSFKKEFLAKQNFFISQENLYTKFKVKTNQEKALAQILDLAFKEFDLEAENQYKNLFDLDFNLLGQTSDQLKEMLKIIDDLYSFDDIEIFQESVDYLLNRFSERGGKGSKLLHTPKTVCELVSQIIEIDSRRGVEIYDPTYKSGSLLLSIANRIDGAKLFGQDESRLNQKIAKMWTIISGISDFDLKLSNSLNVNDFPNEKFDVVVANPPYSSNWNGEYNEQFYGFPELAPKSKADFAYVQLMIHHLKDMGLMAVLLPMGILFRGGKERIIREHLIKDKNCIDTIIQLPANLFNATAIPVCLMIIKKERAEDSIFFIDASDQFVKERQKNYFSLENIEKIVAAYKSKKNIDGFSCLAESKKIEDNDYNLGVNRYVDKIVKEEEINLENLEKEIFETEKEIAKLEQTILDYYKEIDTKSARTQTDSN